MGSIVPFLVIVGIVISIVSKYNKAEKAKKQREAQQYAAQQAVQQSEAAERPAPAARPEYRGSMQYSSTEGKTFTQGGSLGAKPTVSSAGTTLKSGAKHVVRATAEGGHTHIESTAAQEDCTDDSVRLQADHAYDLPTDTGRYELEFDRESVKKALIYSEIIGKPRAKQPARMAGRR